MYALLVNYLLIIIHMNEEQNIITPQEEREVLTREQVQAQAQIKNTSALQKMPEQFPWILTAFSLIGTVILIAGVWFFMQGVFSNWGPVALVNGEEISRALYNERFARQEAVFGNLEGAALASVREQIIDMLVVETLLIQKAVEAGIVVADSEVDTYIATVKEQLGGEDAFVEGLQSEGITEAKLREIFRNQLLMQKYVESQINFEGVFATDEEVRAVYDQAVAGREEMPSFEEVKEQVRASVMQQKQQQLIQEFIQALRDESEIVIL